MGSVQLLLMGRVSVPEREGGVRDTRDARDEGGGMEEEKRTGKAVLVYMDKREIWKQEITYS